MGKKQDIDDRFKKFGTVSFAATTKVNDFIDHLDAGKVMGTRCLDCGMAFFPPRADCFQCLSSHMEWFEISAAGKLVTYSKLEFGPVGFEGDLPYTIALVIAGLLAAMSSSISATLNSASTLITMDFVSKINKNITNKGLVRSGQIATVVLVILAAVWSPMVETVASSLWEYLQLVLGYISPPVVAVFMVGLFYKRANGHGAFYSLILGYLLSITFILFSRRFDGSS